MSEKISFEEYLKQNETLTYTNVGTSMLPLLRQGKDLFTVVRKGPERCRIGDVVLYKRNKQYVLHRIIEVREHDYVILGDNCIRKEYGITDSDILGVMTGFVRDGKEYSVNDKQYQAYTKFILSTADARTLTKRITLKLKRKLKEML